MKTSHLLFAVFLVTTSAAHAENNISATQSEVMTKLLATYGESAKVEFKEQKGRGTVSEGPFSPEVGRKFFLIRRTWQSHDYTCSGCHTDDPRKAGMHIETHKAIRPLAPVTNADRFVDLEKVELNFKTHCTDLYERDCTAYEKGNFVSYLMSIK